jgi:DNA-binding FadR family transcriptional regulator
MPRLPSTARGGLSAGLLLTPARPANAFEETVQRLLQSIRLGLIGRARRLPPERELAGMLAVSRDTVSRRSARSPTRAGWCRGRGRYGGTFVSDELPTASPRVSAVDRDPTDPRSQLEDTLSRCARSSRSARHGGRGERARRRRSRAALAGV